LGGASAIQSVRLQNVRTAPVNSRLRGFFVRIRDAAGSGVYSSDRLNAENVHNSSQTILVNLPVAVEGHTVEVAREPDPDPSGYSGGNVSHDLDVLALALAEVEYFGCTVN